MVKGQAVQELIRIRRKKSPLKRKKLSKPQQYRLIRFLIRLVSNNRTLSMTIQTCMLFERESQSELEKKRGLRRQKKQLRFKNELVKKKFRKGLRIDRRLNF